MANGVPAGFPDVMNAERTPNATAWLTRMRARPGVAAALAMPNKTLAA
jgi:hypothetical protein